VKRYDDGGTYIVNSLQRARRLEASDPRDNVFALLGISTGFDKGHPDTSANYEKTTKRVYADLAAYILETNDSYDLFSYLDNGSESVQGQRVFEASTLDLPSWVPNWNRSKLGTWHISRSLFGTLEPEPEAQKLTREQIVRANRRITDNRRNIFAVGYILGKIQYGASIVRLQGQDEVAFQRIRDQTEFSPAKRFEQIMRLWSKNLERLPPIYQTNRIIQHQIKRHSGRYHPERSGDARELSKDF